MPPTAAGWPLTWTRCSRCARRWSAAGSSCSPTSGRTRPCGNCDTCLSPPESWDGTVAAQKLLSTVVRLRRERGQKFGAGQIIDILLGKRTAKVMQHRPRRVERVRCRHRPGRGRVARGRPPVAGTGPARRRGRLRHARPHRGQRRRAARGAHGAAAPRAGAARAEAGEGRQGRARPPAELPAEAAPVFEQLRAWRAATAKEQGVPAYVIFHDATLREIATALPATLAELARSTASARTNWPSTATRSWRPWPPPADPAPAAARPAGGQEAVPPAASRAARRPDSTAPSM